MSLREGSYSFYTFLPTTHVLIEGLVSGQVSCSQQVLSILQIEHLAQGYHGNALQMSWHLPGKWWAHSSAQK